MWAVTGPGGDRTGGGVRRALTAGCWSAVINSQWWVVTDGDSGQQAVAHHCLPALTTSSLLPSSHHHQTQLVCSPLSPLVTTSLLMPSRYCLSAGRQSTVTPPPPPAWRHLPSCHPGPVTTRMAPFCHRFHLDGDRELHTGGLACCRPPAASLSA